MKDFPQEYACQFAQSDNEIELRKLAHDYHQLTETYDRMICTGPVLNDGIVPADGIERGRINKNARKVYDLLFIEAQKLGFSRAQWTAAIQKEVEKFVWEGNT